MNQAAIVIVDDDENHRGVLCDASRAEKARAAGCCTYFAKPLPMRSFGDYLRDFLQEL